MKIARRSYDPGTITIAAVIIIVFPKEIIQFGLESMIAEVAG